MSDSLRNAVALEEEMSWLGAVVDAAIRLYLGNPCEYGQVSDVVPPVPDMGTAYGREVAHLSFDERTILALALAPHVRPQLLDPFLVRNPNLDRGFTEFGGIVTPLSGFAPTLETAAFVLAGSDLGRRFAVQRALEPDSHLRRRRLIAIEEGPAAQGFFSVPLQCAPEFLGPFTTGSPYRPAFSSSFPARLLTTPQEWADLVLTDSAMEDVEEILAWMRHGHTLLHDWGLAHKVRPGFRSLFHGPPGTGKTMTASLLGKAAGLDVYRIDLSLVVSKWIGETEKNLAAVFDQSENHGWILFFDEADALFGKRSQTVSANDRYANQEVSFLLQRIEDFTGVAILATNFKGNIDDAFRRRFQSMIYFAMPGPAERHRLWRDAFPDPARLESSVDLEELAAQFEISGGGIVNVLRYASLMAVRRGAHQIRLQDIRRGIRRECDKAGQVA